MARILEVEVTVTVAVDLEAYEMAYDMSPEAVLDEAPDYTREHVVDALRGARFPEWVKGVRG
jgi:hypothetical protein